MREDVRLLIRLVLLALAALALLQVPAASAQDAGRPGRSARVGDIVYRARVRVVTEALTDAGPEPRLQAAVTVTNVGRRPVVLPRWWPNCFFTTLELWRAAGGTRGAPAWNEERWRVEYERATGARVECDFSTARSEGELAPGASETFERDASRALLRDILGDSLQGGRYRAVLRVRPHTAARDARPTLALHAGEVVLPARRGAGRGRSGRSVR